MPTKQRLTQALGGALIFAMFGGALGAYGMYSYSRTWLMVIPLVVTMILIVILSRLQRRVEALQAEPATPELTAREARGRKIFGAVNLALVVAVILAVQYWSGTPTPEYVAPTAGFLVGLHFVALAGPMETRTYWMAGGLICVFALGAAITMPRESWAAVTGLGSAAILWAGFAVHAREVLTALLRRRDSAL